MKIQINTDNNIVGREALANEVSAKVEKALRRFKDYITRVEVHLGDENAGKSGQHDQRCMIEVRQEGLQPVAATALEPTLPQAVQAALDKVSSLLDTQIGKLSSVRRIPPPENVES